MHLRRAAFTCAIAALPLHTLAWDAAGHRTITALALHALPADSTPVWITQHSALIADESVVPDRWRAIRSPALSNANGPDHYIDLEELPPLGLRLEDLPPLRYEFIRAVALARVDHPLTPPVSPAADPAKLADWPGFLPWSICETHARIISSLKTARIIERLRDDARAAGDTAAANLRDTQLEMARADALTHMGILAHYIGDAAQPLHTTIHHHGWIGDNPGAYSTDKGIHAYIDGTIVSRHGISFATLAPAFTASPIAIAEPLNPWPETLACIRRSSEQVTPLYELKKTGRLEQDDGKAFITARFTDAASTLAGFYQAAIDASAPSDRDIETFLKYDKIEEDQFRAIPAAAPSTGQGSP
ncbi:MAG: hypothetical protein IT436_12590 [Phycisphaerales bacterium]|nr:hypothetical protein [Phycisphaerales bacterium]